MKTGGSAFPALNFVVPQDLSEKGVGRLGETQGMSLRDYFAAKAMQAFITNGDYSSVVHGGPATPYDVSAGAYEMADSMLAERDK